MLFERRAIPGLAINSYIIGDEATKRAAVIDPVRDVQAYIEMAKGYTITDILETHVHADFVSGSKELKAALGGKAVIHCSGEGGEEWIPAYADHVVHDGDRVVLGDQVVFEAFHTPGHTPEHLSWLLLPDTLFSGDFLFVGDVGRPDLLGEKELAKLAHQLYNSLFGRLPKLDDSVEVYPAHGAGSLCGKALSTKPHSLLGFERQNNPALKKKPEEEWIRALLKDMPKAPPYFARMKRVNAEGPAVYGEALPGLKKIKPTKQHLIVDMRSPDLFAEGHMPGSVNIPLNPMASTFAGWVLPADRPLAIVSDDPKQSAIALLRVGFDNIAGYTELQGPLETLETLSAEELKQRLPSLTLIDVRTNAEWNNDHISGALHHPFGPVDLDLDRERPIALICGGGTRSSIMASLLKAAGYKQVANVRGGMRAFRNL